jgi:hypothetical protein
LNSYPTATISPWQMTTSGLSGRDSTSAVSDLGQDSAFQAGMTPTPIQSMLQLKVPRERPHLSVTSGGWVLEARACFRIGDSYVVTYRSIPPASIPSQGHNIKPCSAYEFEIIWDVDDIWLDDRHPSRSIAFKFKSHFFNQFKVIGSQNLQHLGVYSYQDQEELLARLVELARKTLREEQSPLGFPSSRSKEVTGNHAESVMTQPSYHRSIWEGSGQSVADCLFDGRFAILQRA